MSTFIYAFCDDLIVHLTGSISNSGKILNCVLQIILSQRFNFHFFVCCCYYFKKAVDFIID